MEDLDDLRQRMGDLVERQLGGKLGERAISAVEPAIRLDHADDEADAAARSRLGGSPLLLPGTPWPTWGETPLSLLALIDLAEVAPLDGSGMLPADGVLNFFYDAQEQRPWGFDPSQADGWRVLHAPADDAVETAAPTGATTFSERLVQFSRTLTLPGADEEVFAGASSEERSRLFDYEERWPSLVWDPVAWPPRHLIGGWPGLVQRTIWPQAQLASHGIYVGDRTAYETERAISLLEGASSWRLLLQLDSDFDMGWIWGDEGRLFFVMRENDIRAADFSKAWLLLQCS